MHHDAFDLVGVITVIALIIATKRYHNTAGRSIMSRHPHNFSKILGAGVVAALLAAAMTNQKARAEGAVRPNIVFILADDLGKEWILSMGEGQASFENGYVMPQVPFRHRVIRDNRWKIWVNQNREVTRLYDIRNDPFEDENLINSDDPEAQSGLARLKRVLDTMPGQDKAPRYRPMPPQPWDRHFNWVNQLEDQQLRQELELHAGDPADYDLDRDHLRGELRARNAYDPEQFPKRFESPQGLE